MEASSGFFGPSLVSDISLVVQILFYLVLSAGVVAQLLKKYKLHDMLQTPVVVLNIFFIIFVMLPSFGFAVNELPVGLVKVPVLVTVVHGLLGTIAQLLAIYCLLAGFKILPRKIGTLRYWMWATYAFWTATVIFGVGVYIVFYTNVSTAAQPADQPEQMIEEHDADLGQQVDPPAEAEPQEQVDIQPTEGEPTEPPQEVVSEHAEEVVEQEAAPATEPEPEAAPAEPTPIPEPTEPPPAPEPAEEQPPVAEGEAAPATEPEWVQLQAANAGPGPRYEFAMQFSPATNQVYFFGGRDGTQDYNDVWALNLADLSWRQLAVDSPTAPQQRHSTNMIIDEPSSSLFIATGQGPGGVLNDVWRLDLTTEIWEDLSAGAGEAPTPRYGGPGGNIGGNLLATHGFGSTRFNDTWQFNVASQQWENITPAGEKPLHRCLFAAAPVNTDLVIHGGCASGFGPCPLDDTWVLDTTAQSWRQISSATQPSARQHQSLVNITGLPQVLLFGGQNSDNAPLNDLWLLDVAANSWQSLPSGGPPARYNHAAVWIPAQGMLVYGGRAASALDDLWLLRMQPQGAAPPPPPPTEPPPVSEPPPEPTPTPELIDPEPTDDTVSEHDGG